jgi:hypothetical protein
MARIEDIERRLLNWARWKAGGRSGGLGYSAINLQAAVVGGGRDGYREATIPTNDCEADETDQAVLALPSELRRTVEVVYVEGGGMAQKARRLCCAEPTVHARIDQAHRKISRWLADQDASRKAQRELVERLQASVRRGF